MNTDDLQKLAVKLMTDGPVKVLPTPRRVRGLLNGQYLFDTTTALLVWEHPFYPQYYVPSIDLYHPPTDDDRDRNVAVSLGVVLATGPDGEPLIRQWNLQVGGKAVSKVIAFSTDLTGPGAELAGLLRIEFASLDAWFEEDTPIYVHPKDPFKRIDILQSTRHIRVSIDGQQVAETRFAMHLYETGLPVRYYMPLTAVKPGVLRNSETRTKCPYKGEANYYSVVLEKGGKVWEDVVWWYENPILESGAITGLLCFYNEKVDIELDGEILERPNTHFGRAKPGVRPSIT